MKILFGGFVIIQLIAGCVCVPPKEVYGVKVSEQESFYRQTSAAVTCEGQSGPLCASDCQTLMTCAGKPQSVYNKTCPQYCSGSACSSTLLPSCQLTTQFTCTSEGTFPDPSDCSIYYYCSATGATPTQYVCPPSYAFTLATKMCTYGGFCQTINCALYQNNWIQYNYLNQGYYVFCGTPPLMYKCPDAHDYIFDTITQQCRYNCPYIGSFVDPFNCTQYLTCTINAYGDWNVTTLGCTQGSYFNGVKCTLGTCTSQRKTTTSPTSPPATSGKGDTPGKTGGDASPPVPN